MPKQIRRAPAKKQKAADPELARLAEQKKTLKKIKRETAVVAKLARQIVVARASVERELLQFATAIVEDREAKQRDREREPEPVRG